MSIIILERMINFDRTFSLEVFFARFERIPLTFTIVSAPFRGDNYKQKFSRPATRDDN